MNTTTKTVILNGKIGAGWAECYMAQWEYWTKFILASPYERRRMKQPRLNCLDCKTSHCNIK